MRRRALLRLAGAVLIGTGLGGCSSSPRAAAPPAVMPTYRAIAEAHNARVARLSRFWARAAVRLRYTDQDGKRHREQGEGHLQIIEPDRLALSVGKVGEIIFWLGSDAERFWWFELGDPSRASVARHENAFAPCIGEIALPVHPLDLLDMLALTPIPADRPGVVPVAGPQGRAVVDLPSRAGARRLFFDPNTMRVARVELWLPGAPSASFTAELDQYERVDLPASPGVDPRAASRARISHPESGTEMTLFLSDMSDGSRFGRLNPSAFIFEDLLDSLDPDELVVLDADCAHPAVPVADP